MAKRTKSAAPAMPDVSQEEQSARWMMAAQIIQELNGVELKLGERMEEQAKLKSKLDQVKDDCKSLDAKANKLRMEVIDAHEGRSTGRLPFGPGVPAEKTVTVEDLGTTPAALRDCHYPNLLARLNDGEEPSVTKAITLEKRGDLRFILIDVGDVYRLLALHPSGWQSPSSQPELPGLTGKVVDFLDAKLVIGHAGESPLVEVELPPAEKTHGSGGRTDPGGATRGAAVDRARDVCVETMDKLIGDLVATGALAATQDTSLAEEQDLALVMAATGTANPRRWMKTASIDDLGTLQQTLTSLSLERGKWPELASQITTAIAAGIPPLVTDDFADGGENAGTGQDGPDSHAGEAGEGAEGETAARKPKGRKSPGRPKGSGGKKSGAPKKAKKAKK